MFRLLSSLLTLGALIAGGWWTWHHVPPVRQFVLDNFEAGDLLMLQAHYSAEQIIERHRHELLTHEESSFRRPELLLYPYLLMEVKYTDQKATREGVILWGLDDGEMVIDANTWEKTHGFEDCINAGASREDYRLIHALAEHNTIHRSELDKILYIQEEMLDRWVESCRKKHLIVQNGDKIRLHFQNPKLQVNPETRLSQPIVTQPRKQSPTPGRYSASQIEKAAQATFGEDFTIRYKREVYLPIHRITVQQPDGTIRTSHFNALNGQPIRPPL